MKGRRAFRIIPLTPFLNKEEVPSGYVKMYVKGGNEANMYFYISSLEKSPGIIHSYWKDGNPLLILIRFTLNM